MDNYLQVRSEECFWRIFTGTTWGVLALIAVGLVVIFVARKLQTKQTDNETSVRMKNLKFWSFIWLLAFIWTSTTALYYRYNPKGLIEKAACRFKDAGYLYNDQILTGWLIVTFFIIPIILEYWSIKSGKKNPSQNHLSGTLIASVVSIVLLLTIYISYYFYKRIMAQ